MTPSVKNSVSLFLSSTRREFALNVAKGMGYDLKSGRMDISAPPCSSTIGPQDSRIT